MNRDWSEIRGSYPLQVGLLLGRLEALAKGADHFRNDPSPDNLRLLDIFLARAEEALRELCPDYMGDEGKRKEELVHE